MSDMAVFAGSDLKKWRESQGMSAADLAERISCDTTTLYRYESGKLKPNPDIMFQICEALGDIDRWTSSTVLAMKISSLLASSH